MEIKREQNKATVWSIDHALLGSLGVKQATGYGIREVINPHCPWVMRQKIAKKQQFNGQSK